VWRRNWRGTSGHAWSRNGVLDRKVVLLQGDGSAMYTNQALWSMAMEKTNVTIVLMKNDLLAISPISWRPTISLAG
jgi:acetolactate synthase-1/2/3 large subunit